VKTLSGRAASQNEDELSQFIDLIKERVTTSYLEIGARHGDTFHEVVRAMPKGSRATAVDLGGGAWGSLKSIPFLKAAADALRSEGYDVTLIFGDSTDMEIVRAVADCGRYDVALIDGDHRYCGVKADWLNYGPMANVVAFHDIAGTGERERSGARHEVEVPRLWQQIKGGYVHQEFVAPDSTMGIGVIFK